MRSTYSAEDVEILLKDITGLVEPLPTEAREKRIQEGTHYCEMLPLEYQPSEKYMEAYEFALETYAKDTAAAVAKMAEKVFARKGQNVVLISLARAGLPIGVLAKRYIEKEYKCSVRHYSISIIRGRGIDHNAMKYILSKHKAEDIQFLDGWIGKGAILNELKIALRDYPDVDCTLAVVSDPANVTEICGTHEDILIPSSCLNAIVTGLISRTFLRNDIIGKDDFHGAVYYEDLEEKDLSLQFIGTIEKSFEGLEDGLEPMSNTKGIDVVKQIAQYYKIDDINFIKPGIGETTRVLLRRVPWKVLVNKNYENATELKHIYKLAEEKKVSVEICPFDMGNYKTCGIINKLSDV